MVILPISWHKKGEREKDFSMSRIALLSAAILKSEREEEF